MLGLHWINGSLRQKNIDDRTIQLLKAAWNSKPIVASDFKLLPQAGKLGWVSFGMKAQTLEQKLVLFLAAQLFLFCLLIQELEFLRLFSSVFATFRLRLSLAFGNSRSMQFRYPLHAEVPLPIQRPKRGNENHGSKRRQVNG